MHAATPFVCVFSGAAGFLKPGRWSYCTGVAPGPQILSPPPREMQKGSGPAGMHLALESGAAVRWWRVCEAHDTMLIELVHCGIILFPAPQNRLGRGKGGLMSRGLISSVKAYMKNSVIHVWRIIARKETARQAAERMSRDRIKLHRAMEGRSKNKGREEAKKLIKAGRQAYNDRLYERAEQKFRDAIALDNSLALAYTYLGHTLYKLDRMEEAVRYWTRAVELSPDSEAASKARKKLMMAERKMNEVRAWIDEKSR
jgi:hypothetical protein